MHFELQARTDRGAGLVELAERLGTRFAVDAPAHDRAATYPHAAIAELREAGYFAAPIPAELGGLGVSCVHDVVVASSRLARGDASVAIGVNMHLAALLNMVRQWQVLAGGGRAERADAAAAALAALARDRVVMSSAVSEPGQDLTRPRTTARRAGDGWRIDGRKTFCTMSPAATHLIVAVGYDDEAKGERYAYATVPADHPGVTIGDDWDALGMRASGSHSVVLEDVRVPRSAVTGGFAAGDAVAYMRRNLNAGLLHAAASLGIAESAHAFVSAGLRRRGVREGDSHTRMLAAQCAIDLSACRAALGRAATLLDELHAAWPAGGEPAADVVALFGEIQAVKTFVNDAAARVCERALTLSGGSGYLNGSPLARAYRDVRAGSFMHPLGANRAYELVAGVALGLEPSLH